MKKAESQRRAKSARNPILLKVTTQLTTKTMTPVAKMRKIKLTLPSITAPLPPSMMCPEKRDGIKMSEGRCQRTDVISQGSDRAYVIPTPASWLTHCCAFNLEQSLTEFLALSRS